MEQTYSRVVKFCSPGMPQATVIDPAHCGECVCVCFSSSRIQTLHQMFLWRLKTTPPHHRYLFSPILRLSYRAFVTNIAPLVCVCVCVQFGELIKEVQTLRAELRSRDRTIAQLALQCRQLKHQQEPKVSGCKHV